MSRGVWAIIPARLGSTRFPEKVLASETGKPLVAHVCDRAAAAVGAEYVRVATDHDSITDAVEAAGYAAVRTDPAHPNGTSRVAEAARVLGLAEDAVVVNVQGDEPEIEPEAIRGAAALVTPEPSRDDIIGTVASPFAIGEDAASPHVVKVATTAAGVGIGVRRAMYFSRSLIPHARDGGPCERLRHVGLYAASVAALRRYVALPATPAEAAECLEQLRWLEHGLEMRVAVVSCRGRGVDTPEDYRAVVERWRQNASRRE